MGQLEGTMNRNDAYTFLMIGRNLERADMTSRIVDVRSAQLLPADTPELHPFDTIQWMSVLKSLSGQQMYSLKQQARVRRAAVLEFLLRDDQFPRACLFCLDQVESCLRLLPRSEGVLDTLAGVSAFLRTAQLAQLDQQGLHEFIDHLQLHVINLHDAIATIYFPARAGTRPAPSFSRSQEQRQTLSLFADSPTST
jgi:uncharacterized alpha-E superfamily protein